MVAGQLHASYWTSDDIIPLSTGEKLLGIYLLVNQHCTPLGCYRLPISYIVADLGLGPETITEALTTLERIRFALYDREQEWVMIPKFLRWSGPASAEETDAIVKALDNVPGEFRHFDELCFRVLHYVDGLEAAFIARARPCAERWLNSEEGRQLSREEMATYARNIKEARDGTDGADPDSGRGLPQTGEVSASAGDGDDSQAAAQALDDDAAQDDEADGDDWLAEEAQTSPWAAEAGGESDEKRLARARVERGQAMAARELPPMNDPDTGTVKDPDQAAQWDNGLDAADAEQAPSSPPLRQGPSVIPSAVPAETGHKPSGAGTERRDDEVFLRFPVKGQDAPYLLTWGKVRELEQTYPDVDVEGEAQLALGWLQDPAHARQQKKKIESYLNNWMRKEMRKSRNTFGVLSRTQDARFKQFLLAWPNKEGEAGARQVWRRLNPDEDTFNAIMAGVRFWKLAKRVAERRGKFFPHPKAPARFLSERVWERRELHGITREEVMTRPKLPPDMKEDMRAKLKEDGLTHLPKFLNEPGLSAVKRTALARAYLRGEINAEGTRVSI